MHARDRVTAVAAATAGAAAVLLIGGALRWTQAVVAGLLVIALIPQLRSRRSFDRIPPLLAALGVAAGLTALQLVPLPHAVLELLQPIGTGLRDEGAALMGTSPWQCLSLDPPGTLRALGMFAILFSVAWIALRIAVSEKGRYWILATVAGIGGVTAVIVGVHEVFGATKLYGLYAPSQAHPKLLGPLLNDNHLGALMAICATVALGLATHTRQRSAVRALWIMVVTACGALAVAGASRGATLALISGLVLAGGMLVGQRFFGTEKAPGSRRRGLTSSLPMIIVAACTVVVIVYASAGDVSNQLSRTTIEEVHQPNSKFAIWRSAEVLVEEAPWFGVGRGAFESAITRVHPASAVSTFSHAENEYVQALVDWGVIGAILLGLAMTWVAVVALRRWRAGPLMAGALAALAAIALQSMFDFGVEMLGIAVPVTAILATVTYVPLREIDARRVPLAAGFRIVQILGLLAAGALLLSSATTTNEEDHEALAADNHPSLPAIHAAIERHPLDYFGYAAAAQMMIRTGQPEGVYVLNHALRLHPLHPGLHHLAARMLARAGRLDQAAIEYAATLRAAPLSQPILAEILARFPPQLAATAIPADLPELDKMISALAEAGATNVEWRWLVRVLDQRPGNTRACDALYADSIKAETLEPAIAAVQRCLPVASQDRRIALGRRLLAGKRYDEAERAVSDVETWPGSIDAKADAWLIVCDARAGNGEWDQAKRCLRRLDVGVMPAERRAEILTRLDRIEQALRAAPAP